MKRFFDIHDKKMVAKLDVVDRSNVASAPAENFKHYFGSQDVRELTLSQYRRMCVQYDGRQYENYEECEFYD